MPVEVRGLDKLFRKLGNAAAIDTLEPPMRRSQLRLQRAMQDYPPKPPNSLYVRTGTLGRKWTTPKPTRSANGLVGKVGNNTVYGPFVQSERFQARRHRQTGWTTDNRAVQDNERAILDDFARTIDRALAG